MACGGLFERQRLDLISRRNLRSGGSGGGLACQGLDWALRG